MGLLPLKAQGNSGHGNFQKTCLLADVVHVAEDLGTLMPQHLLHLLQCDDSVLPAQNMQLDQSGPQDLGTLMPQHPLQFLQQEESIAGFMRLTHYQPYQQSQVRD